MRERGGGGRDSPNTCYSTSYHGNLPHDNDTDIVDIQEIPHVRAR